MTDPWADLIHGRSWQASSTLWVEDGVEHSWEQVDDLAASIQELIHAHGPARVVRVRSGSKLGCFAGQLAAWRSRCVAVADDGVLGPSEIDLVRPDLTLRVSADGQPTLESARQRDGQLPGTRIPDEVVAVNFTSGSTGRRKAVAVSRGNLLALMGCRGLDVPEGDRLVAGSFATPTYDGWWFDTWRTVATGGTVVCLPDVNEDVFGWPELVEKYRISRLLLPAAVIATLMEALPASIAGIPWVFSGGEQFQVSTYLRARQAGLQNRFVNLYGPTEATFATHKYELPDSVAASTIPIGKPLDGCRQRLRRLEDREADCHELVVAGPFVCLGYLENGSLAHRFGSEDGQPALRTGDVVRMDGNGDLVFAGRLDSQLKVNGLRIDAATLEHEVARLPEVSGCRVVQSGPRTVAFVRTGAPPPSDLVLRSRVESVVKGFSTAIAVQLVNRFPVKSGGKIDTAALMDQYSANEKSRQR